MNYYEDTDQVESGTKITLVSGDTFFLKQGVTYGSTDSIGLSASDGSASLTILGSLISTGGDAFYSAGGGSAIDVSVGAEIASSTADAIDVQGYKDGIVNDGTISGYIGINLFQGASTNMVGDNVITNSGHISAVHSDAIELVGGGNIISNSGTIVSTSSDAIDFASTTINDGENIIDNSGTISGGGFAIDASDTYAEVFNSGHIYGSVIFGKHGGYYNGSEGSITGFVYASGGTSQMIGGAGTDFFVLNSLKTSDSLNGNGGDDLLVLNGGTSTNVVLSAKTIVNIETLEFDRGGNYRMTTNDATVAAGATLTVDGSDLQINNKLTFNGAAETNGHFVITGGLDGDVLTGGKLSDIFVYTSAAQSTSKTYDTINAFNFKSDKFDVTGKITKIDTGVSHAVSTSSFDTDIKAAASALGEHHAMLVTANGGSLQGDVFLVIDENGHNGYQTGHDLVIELHGATGTLTTADFI